MQGVFQRTLWYPPKSDTPTIPGRTAMIVTNQVHRCRDCSSEHIVRNGRNRCRSQQYLCHECGGAARFTPKRGAQGRGRLPGGGAGAAGLPQVPQLQRLLEGIRGHPPGGNPPLCPQGGRGDRAHGTLVQHPGASPARPSPFPRRTGGTIK